MFLLQLFISILSLYFYIIDKKHLFLVFLCSLLYKFFYFLPPTLFELYLASGVVLIICGFEFFRNYHFFSTKGDVIAKAILFISLYYFLSFLLTILLGIDLLKYAFMVFLRDIFLLSYFIFRKLRYSDLKKAARYLFVISLIGGGLYYLQFAGIKLIQGLSDNEMVIGEARYMNFPPLLVPIILYLIYFRKPFGRFRLRSPWIYLLFLFPILILIQSRGLIVSFLLSSFFFAFLDGNKKLIFKIVVATILVGLIFGQTVSKRFSGENTRAKIGFVEEISQAFEVLRNYKHYYYVDGDTFTFRMGIFGQRINYIMEHPRVLFFGVGSIAETSPKNAFNFDLGSGRRDADGVYIPKQIDTTDMAYVTHLFRYGISYLVFIAIFVIFSFKRLWAFRKSIWAIIGLNILLISVIQSLGSSPFFDFSRMIIMILTVALFANRKNTRIYETRSNYSNV